MPEGPEVKIITDGLNALLGGHKLLSIEITSKNRYYKKAPDGFQDFLKDLPTKITKINCHGKFIWWDFANGWKAWQTLGLSGGWFLHPKAHSGIILHTTHPKYPELYYDDQRHFGTLKFLSPSIAKTETIKKLKTLGPDILAGDKITRPGFITRLKTKPRMPIANLLMEQKVIAGIGNYLRSEILYDSQINPHRLVGDLNDTELGRIYDSARKKITASYKSGGASIQHYSDIYSKPGKFEFEMHVYGRKKTPSGEEVKAVKIGKDTQTTYWVPSRQI